MNPVARAKADAGLGATIVAAALMSWLVPERLWMPLARSIGHVRAGANRPQGTAPPFDEAVARIVGCSPRSLRVERIASGHASRLWGLREYVHRRRNPPIDVGGRIHVEQALAGNTGAILWVARFTWASIITKMGMHQAGIAVAHLSRPTHGFGTSPFATRWLNPVWTRIEERFVDARIVMEPRSERAALRTLRQRLAENGVVSITVGDEGVRTVSVPFLEGTLALATGPISLAASSGAPLLPVFTVREPGGQFRIEIESDLEVPVDDARDRREERVAELYARRLETWVRRYPGQWLP